MQQQVASSPEPITYEFPEKMQFLFQPARFKVGYGGRLGLKSWSFARALLILGLTGHERILCVREMQKSMEESVHKLLADQITLMQMNYLYEVQQAHILGRGRAQGTSFSFEGIWRNVNKIKSYEGITRCWGEEAAKISKSSWGVLEPTIRVEGSEIWLSFNPELDEDFVYQYFVLNEPPPGSVVVKTSYRDNRWLSASSLASIIHLKETDYDEYLHVYEGHTKQVLEGAIFASELRAAVEEERIRHVPYDRSVPVDVIFDLGRNDFTAMWFVQRVGFEYHIIDFYQNRLHHIDHYLKVMQDMGYLYGSIFLPHDAYAKQLGTRLTIQEQISAKYPNQTRKVPKQNVQDQINAARTVFPKCYFDAKNTQEGIRVLRKWCYKIDPVTKHYSQQPEHDGYDAAAAFCYFAIATGLRVGTPVCKLDLPNAVRERNLGARVTDVFNQTAERILGNQRASTRWLGR